MQTDEEAGRAVRLPCKSDSCGGEIRKVGSLRLQCSSQKVLEKSPQAKVVVKRILSPTESLVLVFLINHCLAGLSVEKAQRW